MPRGFPEENPYKAGDPPPPGYVARQEWAKAQMRAGMKQQQCKCGIWLFPQEREIHVCREGRTCSHSGEFI
jgi:hypothetical protein